ncbi:MAG: DUF6503 family protein [Rhodothermales bacterium]|nr:DUF6503 family protein [Rhodothermales bacterium]
MRTAPALFALALLLSACAASDPPPDPYALIERARAAHGSDVLHRAVVEFDFRGKHFTVTRDGGAFRYERTYTDSTGAVREILDNDGIRREIDGQGVALTDSAQSRLATPLNSVPYFALLPFNLTDPAVQARYLGPAEIEGEPYHEVEVTFAQEDGGRDWEDRFIYWFHQDRHTMDYLAYGFHVDDGGTRFRKAVNPRRVGGVLFTDHLNYTAPELPDPTSPVHHFDSLYSAGRVELLSEINLENVTVRPLQ